MPEVPEQLFLHGLRELVKLDRDWVPPANRGALYVRPCLFSIDPSVRVKPPNECLFVIFTFPFTDYYRGAVDLLVSEHYVRAFPGGTGDVKPAGNYAPALVAEREAQQAGLHSVLWLDGIERSYIEECGVMNVFFVIGDTVVTPPLAGTILAGVTRESALTVMRDLGMPVVERPIALKEILAAHADGSLRECFGTGTAATVSPVRRIRYRNQDIELPPPGENSVSAVVRTSSSQLRRDAFRTRTAGSKCSERHQKQASPMKHFLMFYELAEDYLARRGQYREIHLKKAWESHARGELVLGGALADPVDGAMLLFQRTRAPFPKSSPRPIPT